MRVPADPHKMGLLMGLDGCHCCCHHAGVSSLVPNPSCTPSRMHGVQEVLQAVLSLAAGALYIYDSDFWVFDEAVPLWSQQSKYVLAAFFTVDYLLRLYTATSR